MSHYLIGDIQGCNNALARLLLVCDFSPSRDHLYLLGDLVNRGPDSVGVLRRIMALGGAAHALLGNHDLHLLAAACGARTPHSSDTLAGVLQAPDREALLNWLRHQRLAMRETFDGEDVLMVHAGVLPSWTAGQTLAFAREVETVLQTQNDNATRAFFSNLYGNLPARWHDDLKGADRLRCIVNALTRLRFCTLDGDMEFATKEAATAAPPGHVPWFDVPQRRTQATTVAFGHWSTLGWLVRTDLLALDSGCVWGGKLTAVRFSTATSQPTGCTEPSGLASAAPGLASTASRRRDRLEVPCEPAQSPG